MEKKLNIIKIQRMKMYILNDITTKSALKGAFFMELKTYEIMGQEILQIQSVATMS